nr:MAG: hypothetical protein [Penaeus semisulcatus pemonivirus]
MTTPIIISGLIIAGIGVIAICCLVYCLICMQPVRAPIPVDTKSIKPTLDPDFRSRYIPKENGPLTESDLLPDNLGI